LNAIDPKDPIDHRRRRQTLIDSCATWLKSNGLSESRAEFLANFIERNTVRWARDIERPSVSNPTWRPR
jgi:hypothetical protein